MLQKQNFKQLGHYPCMQCGTSHLQTVQDNILSHIILETYRTFTVATVIFTQNIDCNIYTHPRFQQVAYVTMPIRFNKEQTLNLITDNVTIRQTRTGNEFNNQLLILNSTITEPIGATAFLFFFPSFCFLKT